MNCNNIGQYLMELRKYYKMTQDQLAEGYFTVKALRNLGKNYGVELPICEAVYEILYCKADPSCILEMLFARNLKNEF